MSRSNWRVVLAAVGFLTLCAAAPKGQHASREQQQYQRNIAESLNSIDASLKEATKPDVASEPCRDGKDHRESDLCAQWKAADAAQSAANATWLFGVFGTMIGGLTLAAAWAAAKWAKKAAQHTEEGAIEARKAADAAIASIEHAKSGERAWLCFDSPSWGRAQNITREIDGGRVQFIKNGFQVTAEWKNFGPTPATQVTAYRTALVIKPSDPLPSFPMPESDGGVSAVVGPEAKIECNTFFLDDEETRAFIARDVVVALYSRVLYRDIFSPHKLRTSEACMLVRYQGGHTDENGIAHDMVAIYPAGPQNTVT